MKLRPYQVEAVNAIRAEFAKGARAVCYQLPTGGGKSLIFGEVARLAAEKKSRVLILVHRRELLLQGSRTLRKCGIAHGIVAPRFPYTNHPVRIASVQTLVRRLEHAPGANIIICDEAHHARAASYERIWERWPHARILGVTATPARLDGKGLRPPFGALVQGPSMKSLVSDGYLAPCEMYAPPTKADLSAVKTTMGDFDKHELAVVMDRSQIVGDCVEHYQRLAPGRLGIAFCVSIEHARHVAQAFSAAGIPSESIDGEMDERTRDGVLERFAAGKIRVLTSCELVSEGFDLPECEVAILLRPTKSLTIYLQQVGRVMRPCEGKENCLILDHVGNIQRLGLPDEERKWDLDGIRRRKGKRAPAVSRCPECFACFPPGPTACPSCGALLPIKERKGPEFVDGELKKIDAEAYADARAKMRAQHWEQGQCQSYEDLVALGRSRGYAKPEGWAWRVWNGRRGLVTA